jgi:hypothetical protein
MLDEANMPYSRCRRCNSCDGFPCLVHAKGDAEVMWRAGRPWPASANVSLLTRAEVKRLHTDASGRTVTAVELERDGEALRCSADLVRGELRCGQQRPVAADVGQRQAPPRPGEWLRSGGAQLHVPQQQGSGGAVARAQPHHLPEDDLHQRLVFR